MPDEEGVTQPADLPEIAFRRAMMAANPDYFSWDQARQEHYRLEMDDEVRFKIKQAVIKSLFDLSVANEDDLEDLLRTFNPPQYLLLNSAMLLARGIGKDLFYLNEPFAQHRALGRFETLGEVDHHDHCWQQDAEQAQDSSYVPQPYRGALRGTWARLRIDGQFFYASLWMASWYLQSQIDDWGHDAIETLIPHRYVPGEHHGKRETGGTRYDMRVDADGQEAQLDELNRRFYRYLVERQQTLADRFDQEAQGCLYLLEDHWDSDPHMQFVFTDKTALQAVRIRQFMADCRKISGDRRALSALEEQEKQAVMGFIEHQFRDIQDHFDPTIVRFRKKRKVVLADGALDDLLD